MSPRPVQFTQWLLTSADWPTHLGPTLLQLQQSQNQLPSVLRANSDDHAYARCIGYSTGLGAPPWNLHGFSRFFLATSVQNCLIVLMSGHVQLQCVRQLIVSDVMAANLCQSSIHQLLQQGSAVFIVECYSECWNQ